MRAIGQFGIFLVALALIAGVAGCQTSGGQAVHVEEKGDPLAETNVDLGIGYMRQGNMEFALTKLRKALELDPDLPRAHYAIALLYERLRQNELAEQHYRRAIELNPQYAEAQNAYGVFLCRRQRLEKADQHFQLALKNPLYQTPAIARVNAGVCALHAKDYDRAETYLRSALQRNPKSPVALHRMAELSYETENHLQARAYLQRYLGVAKHTPQTLWLGIRIERELGNKNAVSSYALLLKSNFPDSRETRLLRQSGER